MWAIPYLVYAAISIAISYALRPKPNEAKPASLEEIEVPTAESDRSVPVIFGTVTIEGPNVVWWGDLDTDPVRSNEI